MKYVLKSTVLVLLLIGISSCDIVTDLFTTNYFEGLDSPASNFITAEDWNNLSDEEKQEKLEEYTTFFTSEDAKSYLENLADNASKDFINLLKAEFSKKIENEPSITVDTTVESYSESVTAFQEASISLARIEIYTNGGGDVITNLSNILPAITTGETITSTDFIKAIFKTDSATLDETKNKLNGFLNASSSYSKIGSSILDKDNPDSGVLSEGDGFPIFVSGLVNRIVSLTDSANPDTVLTNLATQINLGDSGDFTGFTFPSNYNSSTDGSILDYYLGADLAVAFMASEYELPNLDSLGGAQ